MLVVMRGLRRFDQGGTPALSRKSALIPEPHRWTPRGRWYYRPFSDLVWVLREVALVPRSWYRSRLC